MICRSTAALPAFVAAFLAALLITGCGGSTPPPPPPSAPPTLAVFATPPTRLTPNPTSTPMPGNALGSLSTAEQLARIEPPLRNRAGLAAELNPAAGPIPTALPARATPLRLGAPEPFWVRDTGASTNVLITATLVYSTPVVYIWVQDGEAFDRAGIERSADRFTEQTYPRAVAAFGREWRPGVDGDDRLHILYNTVMGPGVAGYFSSADESTRAASPFSNQKEMFYISLATLNRSQDFTYLDTTLAHELQHMIHWNMDRGEDLWLNEGLSEYAQEIAGFAADSIMLPAFAQQPDLQLTTWNETTRSNAPHYGSAYLFVAYLAQRFGPQIIPALVAAGENGLAGVTAALRTVGADADAESVFADWVVANYARQPGALDQPGRYGYIGRDTPAMTAAARYERIPAGAKSGQVYNFATDYIELALDGDATLTFAGSPNARLVAAELTPGQRVWWPARSDDANPRLTRQVDLAALAPGQPVTMTTQMWWEIEPDYDYGYLMASRDGEHWQIVPGQRTRLDAASGNALGPGYSGRSGPDGTAGAWVQEAFDLSDYANGPLWLRFSYVTDDGVTLPGWLIGDINLWAGGELVYSSAASGPDGWQSEGWLWTDNRLPQRWLLQVLEFDGDSLTAVRRVPVDDAGNATIDLRGLDGNRRAVLAISGLTGTTTEAAAYTVTIDPLP